MSKITNYFRHEERDENKKVSDACTDQNLNEENFYASALKKRLHEAVGTIDNRKEALNFEVRLDLFFKNYFKTKMDF